jgi:hypothetical protein
MLVLLGHSVTDNNYSLFTESIDCSPSTVKRERNGGEKHLILHMAMVTMFIAYSNDK